MSEFRKVKKGVQLILFIFLLLWTTFNLLQLPTTVSASASETEREISEELNENIQEQLNQLDLEALQEYINSLGDFTNKSVSERLIAYIQGEEFDYSGFAKQIFFVLFEKISELLPSFACITAIALLMGLIGALRSSTLASTSSELIFFIGYTATLIPLMGILIECFQSSTSCVSSMQKQMQLLFPLMLTLMAASGGTLSAAVCRPAVAFFSTTIVSIISSVVFPLTITIIAFSMAGNLTKEFRINKFTAFFKSINKWIIGICISVFGLFFTLQGITSSTYDGIFRRAAKYAIGTGIPIVGGFLSGGFDLAVAGSVLIKNSLGSLGIFLMVFVLFEPLVLLLAVNLLLRLTAAVTQPFSDSRISDFLGETAENLHYCTAGLLFTAFLYFLSMILMICSSEILF